MASSLSNIVDNPTEGIHKIKCKYRHDKKKSEMCRINYKYSECYLEYTNIKDDLVVYKRLCYNNNYQKRFDENFKKRFSKTYKFSNRDINKSILLFRKRSYPYECMHDWEKLNKISLHKKRV